MSDTARQDRISKTTKILNRYAIAFAALGIVMLVFNFLGGIDVIPQSSEAYVTGTVVFWGVTLLSYLHSVAAKILEALR